MTLTEDELSEFVCGKCVDLASAIHRITGWEIQAVIEPADEHYPAWVGHAWCVDPTTGNCVDIDGSYPPAKNGWVGPGSDVRTGLNEAQLRVLTTAGAGVNWDPNSWDSGVEAAMPVAREYVLPQLAAV
jgi:hypothetical protein